MQRRGLTSLTRGNTHSPCTTGRVRKKSGAERCKTEAYVSWVLLYRLDTKKAERRQTPAPTTRSWVPREPQQSQVACGPTTTGRSQPSQKALNTLKSKSFNPWRMHALCADAALHLLEPLSRLPSLGGCPAHHADALQNASGCASVVRGTGTPNTKCQSKAGRGTAWWAKACVSPDQPSRCAYPPLSGGQSWNSTDLALHVEQASVQRSERHTRPASVSPSHDSHQGGLTSPALRCDARGLESTGRTGYAGRLARLLLGSELDGGKVEGGALGRFGGPQPQARGQVDVRGEGVQRARRRRPARLARSG